MWFRIAVNEKPENVVFLIQNRYNIIRRSAKTYYMSGNIFEVYRNEDYDNFLAENEDGWLYYNTHMDFFPIDDKITVSQEIEIAENIKHFLDSCSLKSEIIFESDEYIT
ncbi:MAG: hypothetical protein K2L10_08785 [Ruminococcus sp.]|nr:hypothetical protein [Ruminococcus sp.]